MAKYLLIGSGRTARHFSHYFQALGLQFDNWSRKESFELLQLKLEKATHVLVLISDSAIQGFYESHLKGTKKLAIHCSGALEIEGIISAHPLMTFANELYDLSTYKEIPFILTTSKSISEVLPGLPNPSYQIQPEQKALYHALCVGSGNFTTLLWQKMAQGMDHLGLPADVHIPYMKAVFKNLLSPEASRALTGPLARKDLKTVLTNDRALSSDPFQHIYRAFVQVYFPEAFQQIQEGGK